ncbi:MAG: ABC transporter ATP-binding protein [Candidatus Hodarchaeales archaeon]|jgi:putative ABC transport system ATP-binding protein
MASNTTTTSSSQESPIILSIENLKKTFVSGRFKLEVLKDINFKIEQAEWVAIMGPSGSGKTTLLNIIGLLDQQYDNGKILIEGNDIQRLGSSKKASFRSNRIGIVFQNHFLVSTLTALENVELPFIWSSEQKISSKEIEEKALSAIEMVGLTNRANYFPEELSGGELQRIAIARAISHNPGLVLLDEPTGNLDAQTGKAVLNLFRNIVSQGTSIIMVTHDSEAAKLADRILLLRDGRIINLQKNSLMDVKS